MKIHFNQSAQADTAVSAETARESGQRQVRRQQAGKSGGYAVYFDGRDRVHPGNAAGGCIRAGQSALAGRGKTMAQLQAQAEGTDIRLMQDQMTVMSHTMSDEDYAQMCEEGYDPRQMDPRDAVTILDKIKSELVKGGCRVVGYTDTLDLETLTAAVGDPGLARTLQESFAAEDIPLTAENVEKTLQALELADSLEPADEGDYYYMIRSGLEASVKGYYLAEASGSAMEQEQQAEYFDAGVRGYVTRNIAQPYGSRADDGESGEAVSAEEIDRLLASLGCAGTEQEREAASWLIQRGIQVDRDTLRRTMEICSVPFPLQEERVVQAAAGAIADGYEPMEGNLADPRSIRQKARDLAAYYQSSDAELRITDHRLLEEVRLRMTVETNIRLLESGFSIDTQPIEETIEALKQAQRELAREYFPQPEITDGEALERYQVLETAWQTARELPGLPVDTVGQWQERVQKAGEGTLEEFHQLGKTLQAEYEKAGQRYEAIWTSPRADMGDSIRKAFANVDELLKDMGYELTEENRRAVRVLGYNRMEITPEHMEEIKTACTAVEEVTRRMTPAAVLQMIRDGVNPLEQSLPQLQEYFERQNQDPEQETERYSRFLYKLEKKGDITPEEKSAFIGCYRLLRQIEKGDSAAIGSVVNMGAEMNFSTLLSAVRSRRAGHMNTRVDDAVGGLSRLEETGIRIDEQIRMGYGQEWNQVLNEAIEPDAEEAGASAEESGQLRQAYEQAAGASREICRQLERAGESPAAANVLAAQGMESEIREILNRWNTASRREKPDRLWEQLQSPQAFRELYQEAVEEQEGQFREQILEETDSLVDVRSLQLLSKQLHLMGSLSRSEEYYFPMELGGELAAIHLQICCGEQEKGLVRIELTSGCMGSLKGEFQVKDGVVNGYFAGNQEKAVMNLRRRADIFDSYLAEGLQLGRVEYVHNASGKTTMSWDRMEAEEATEQSSLYATAKAFLQTVRDVEKQMEGNPA